MLEGLVVVSVVLALASTVIGVVVLWKLVACTRGWSGTGSEDVKGQLVDLGAGLARLREDLARLEAAHRAEGTAQRVELGNQLASQRAELSDRVAKLQGGLESAFTRLGTGLAEQVQQLITTSNQASAAQATALTHLQHAHAQSSDALRGQVAERLDAMAKTQADAALALRGEVAQRIDRLGESQRLAGEALRATLGEQLAATRGEITAAVGAMNKDTGTNLTSIAERVSGQLSNQERNAGESLEKLRTTVELKLSSIQAAADAKLEQMRATVDEKLSGTLNTRLGESFKLVSDRLEAVQSGLGEMRTLAGNVTDLRRVMTNVKTRGVWGEVQLANLLEQLFAPDQYEVNFKPRPRSGETVEFALRLPGPGAGGSGDSGGQGASVVYLPIDSKFPVEDFHRLVEAAELGLADGVRDARKQLENRIYACAKDIRDKYIAVPTTTDFAILFLPTEALHAEVLKIPGLLEEITRDYKVIVQGPTTFSAFSMALLMGFRTLAIQKRSADIANLLGAIKNDFSKFSDLLGKVEEKLDDAKTNIGKARQRSGQIVRKLGRVEELPAAEARLLLPDPAGDPDAYVPEDQG